MKKLRSQAAMSYRLDAVIVAFHQMFRTWTEIMQGRSKMHGTGAPVCLCHSIIWFFHAFQFNVMKCIGKLIIFQTSITARENMSQWFDSNWWFVNLVPLFLQSNIQWLPYAKQTKTKNKQNKCMEYRQHKHHTRIFQLWTNKYQVK